MQTFGSIHDVLLNEHSEISWIHCVTNNNILEQIEKGNEILSTVKIQKLSWFGHVGRNIKV